MKRAYISGPIRATSVLQWAVNIFKAWCVARYYWTQGYAVFCPHSNTAFMDRADMEPGAWIKGDLAWIEVSNVMIMMPGWLLSEGARKEHNRAVTLGLDIVYLTPLDVWRAVCLVLSPGKSLPGRDWDFNNGGKNE